MVAFKGWSENGAKWPGGAQLTKPHKDCGVRRLACSACAAPIVARDVEINKLLGLSGLGA
jgi:hypothetical protein